MREDVDEWDFIKKKKLITVEDIKRIVHNHTGWSDGINFLDDL